MVDLSKYSEIIIWGAAFSPNEIEGDATSHGYAVEKLYKLLKENNYADKLVFLLIVIQNYMEKRNMTER